MRRGKEVKGQASVELALVLPLVVVLLLVVVQVGLVVRDQILVVHAAREAAREAAVDTSADAPRRAALASSTLAGAPGCASRWHTGHRPMSPWWAPPWATSPCTPRPPCEWNGSQELARQPRRVLTPLWREGICLRPLDRNAVVW